jgi:hypothetical protein
MKATKPRWPDVSRVANSQPFRGIGAWLQEWWPYTCNVLGACGLGLLGAANDKGRIVLPITSWSLSKDLVGWGGALLLAIGMVGLYRRGRQLGDLKRRVAQAEQRSGISERVVRALSRVELNILSDSLGHQSSERVSLFVPAPGGFVLVARWTKDPTLAEGSQTIYAEGQGCLWKAWQDGYAEEVNLPDPRNDLKGWVDEQVARWNVPRDRAEAMTMRSRTYVAIRIEDRSTGRLPAGVVIFESRLTPNEATRARLKPDDIKQAVLREEPRLRVLLEEMARLV